MLFSFSTVLAFLATGLFVSPVAIATEPPSITLLQTGANELSIGTAASGHTVFYTSGSTPSYPSPTLIMERCQSYALALTNNLNEPTNLHLHGLHISGEQPGDDVWDVEIQPGETYPYTYHVPCNHATGAYWYHPHAHLYTQSQLGKGAAGALIINDPQNKENIPSMYLPSSVNGMRQYIFLAQGNDINGLSNPTIQLKTGEWMMFRIIHTSSEPSDKAVTWNLNDSGNCETYLFAKDGVIIGGNVPRLVSSFFVGTTASRADVIVRCNVAGSYGIENLATLQVQDGACPTDGNCATGAPECFQPARPAYLEDLQNASVDVSKTVSQQATQARIDRTTYNYNSPDAGFLPGNAVIEFDVSGSAAHPFHMHVNHLQILSESKMIQPSGDVWHQNGDWIDTSAASNGAIFRLKTADFAGKMVMHCHISGHADNGGLAYFKIASGYPGDVLVTDANFVGGGTCTSR